MKIEFTLPPELSEDAFTPDEEALRYGLAKRGAQALYGREKDTVTIVKARRTKYAFTFNRKTKGRTGEYIADFKSFRPLRECS